jgi:predicted alpha/beta-fold hydrolase
VALALPVTVVRWWRGGGLDRERSIVDVTSAGLTGAAVAWLIEAWCTDDRPWLAVGCALGAGALAASFAWWRVRKLIRAAAATSSLADGRSSPSTKTGA